MEAGVCMSLTRKTRVYIIKIKNMFMFCVCPTLKETLNLGHLITRVAFLQQPFFSHAYAFLHCNFHLFFYYRVRHFCGTDCAYSKRFWEHYERRNSHCPGRSGSGVNEFIGLYFPTTFSVHPSLSLYNFQSH